MSWSQLHDSLLLQILGRLSLPDYVRFRSVCKSWYNAERLNRGFVQPVPQPVPWLLQLSTSTFYNPDEDRLYTVPFPLNHKHTTSYRGWLLLTENNHQGLHYNTHLFNPITATTILLPPLKTSWDTHHCFTFSSSPSNPDCTVAIPKDSGLLVCNIASGREWTIRRHDKYVIDVVSKDSSFYSLLSNYSIVVSDHMADSELKTLVMDSEEIRHDRHSRYCFMSILRSLVEYEGELYLVAVDNMSRDVSPPDRDYELNIKVRVFKACLGELRWEKVRSLGGGMMFVCEGGAVAVEHASVVGGRRDRIYVARPSFWCARNGAKKCRWCWVEFNMKNGTTTYRKDPRWGKNDRYRNGRLVWVTPESGLEISI